MTAIENASERPAISEFSVKGLHGKFNYTIPLGPGLSETAGLAVAGDERLLLLYGGNGTGKTSLLSLLFHALSPANTRGHRRIISRTRFDRLRVDYHGGDFVEYVRESRDPVAPLRVLVSAGGVDYQSEYRAEWTKGDADAPEALQGLQELGSAPAFLNDSRAFQSDLVERPDPAEERMLLSSRRRIEDLIGERRNADLASSLERVRDHLTELILRGSQSGSQRVDSVYVDLVHTIVEHAQTVGRPRDSTLPEVRKRIAQIAEQTKRYVTFGLTPAFPSDELLKELSQAQRKNGRLIAAALSPYLDGLEERMEALAPGLEAIETYVTAVNGFLTGKHLEFRPGLGAYIFDEPSGDLLAPEHLSSGEKQVVLLLSTLTSMRDATRLFIVDEPELSLNPEWQRALIPALLDVTRASGMQIVAATHSIEIMSRYRSRLRRLRQQQEELPV